ncbi:MAG: hypothetical protein HZC22_15225 [Rhodocyclales bacterium]|nr:hypothetical protein [Rhodocyclales bacterium]
MRISGTRCQPFLSSRNSGQAMTEFLVVALAMLPLFLLIPIIAKYQDMAHATQMAARYVAFDGTIRNGTATGGWKPEATLADEVRRRFFSNSDAPIKTNDVAGDFDAHRNLFWQGPNNQPLLANPSDVTVSFGPGRGAAHGAGFEAAHDMNAFPAVAGTAAQSLGLGSNGIYTANVHIRLANLPAGIRFYEPFDKIDLAMTRSASVVVDPWTARDPGDVSGRIQGATAIFPAGALANVGDAMSAVVFSIEYLNMYGDPFGPKLGKLDFWQDVVPEDRLRSGNQ